MPSNFVDKFIDYNRYEESPTSYFKWAGYTLVSAILRDHVYLAPPRKKHIYPNLYTILLSTRSSVTRKASAMRCALKVLKAVDNTKIVQGTASIPGIIKTISEDFTSSKTGIPIHGSAFLLYSEEFTACLHIDNRSIDILTDWYDGHDDWRSSMAVSGIHKIERVCPTILGASNEENIREIYTTRAQKGGLLARTALIREDKRRFIKSMWDTDALERDGKEEWKILIQEAKKIAELEGQFSIDREAIEEYESWYFSITDEKISESGIEGRVPYQALKLSIIMAASELEDVVRRKHIEHAIEEQLEILKNYRIFIAATVGSTPVGRMGALVIRELYNSNGHGMTKPRIMRNLLSDLDPDNLDKVLDSYNEAGIIIVDTGAKGGPRYDLTEFMKDKISEGLEKKK
jgi:hypothetical protein